MDKYKRLAGDTLVFAIGNMGSKLILFLLVPIYTNYLSTTEYGTAEFIYTVANLLMPITSLVIFDSVLRFTLDKNNISNNVVLNASIVFLGGSLLSLIITPFFGLYPTLSEWKWYLSAYIISYMAFQIFTIYIKAKEKTKLYAVIGVSQTLLLGVLNIILLVVFETGIKGYLIANITANFIITFFAFYFGGIFNDLKESTFDKVLFVKMLKYSIPLILNNISWWVVQSSDKVMVELIVGSSALGLYTVSSKIPALINVITSIFSQSWGISSIKEYDSSKDTTFYANVFSFFCFIVFLFCACINLIIKPFMAIYVSDSFFIAWKYVPLLLVAAAFSALSAYFGAIYSAIKKSFNVMLSTVFSAFINITLNFILIPKYEIMGAVIATAVAYIFIAIYRMIDTRRFFRFNISFSLLIAESLLVIIDAIFVSLDLYGGLVSIITITALIVINKKILIKGNDYLKLFIKRGKRNNTN